MESLVDWLTDELGGPHALLILDDVDLLDAGTATVVLEAVRRTRCAVVMSCGRDLTRPGAGTVAALLAHCAPAEVRVLPLGFGAMTGLVSTTLGAAPDVPLVSAVTARSAGNPRVAQALVRAARFAGAIRCVDGRWTKVRPLDEAPLDAVAHTLLPRLDEAQVEVLEHVALRRTVAEDELDPATVARLLARGRLVAHPGGDGPGTLVVSPPALASALRQRHRRGVSTLVEQVPSRAPTGLGRLLLTERGTDDADYWRVAAQLTSLVQERSALSESAARADWLRAPTVPHATTYLTFLLRRPASDLVEAVLRDTRPRDDDPPEATTALRLHEARWAAFLGEPLTEIRRRLGADARDLEPFLSLHERRDRTVAALRAGHGDAPVPIAPDEEARLPPQLRGLSCVAQAAGALEAGRPDVALRLCAQLDRLEVEAEVRHHLTGLRAEAMLMLGDLRGSERVAREHLERALDALDTSGIRVHACVLAQVLMFAGRPHHAWRAISTSLRLGPPGPLEDSYYRRTLVLSATLQVRSGALPVAQILIAELDGILRGSRPLIRSLRVLAHAALEIAQGDDVDAADRMWERGEQYARDGQLQPALLCWLLSAVPMVPARLARVRAAWAEAELPLLDPFLRLHEALAADDAEAALAALPTGRTWIAAGLTRSARAAAGDPRGARTPRTPPGRPPSARVPVPEEPGRLSLQVEVLSDREREVALLARAGLSNRQIADRLVLSVRTVENHMSRALRKLGCTTRADLDFWSEL
ncbi:LuxR C-terminal-related transcriptional regulator [Cellulomonas sp. NPDC058312]|uniref:helix-turn-helix transcriptional regulator n=1 Tax=Cellulomonas sp. NPDC058312 TaxID=3346441 RepID=UPI0036E2D2E3